MTDSTSIPDGLFPVTHPDEAFAAAVWEALKGDHNDLRKQAIILAAHRISTQAPNDAVGELLLVARDAEWAFEGILDTEQIGHDECAATDGFELCGATPCQESGCIVDKLRRTKAALAKFEPVS